MRNRFVILIFSIGALMASSSVASAQSIQQTGATQNQSFDPKDLSGVWVFSSKGTGPANQDALTAAGVTRAAPHATFSTGVDGSAPVPPMTPWAQALYDAHKPGYGPKAAPGGDDPILHCDPIGTPRILVWDSLIEFVQTPGRIIQFFESQHATRNFWMDGRKLPKDPEPNWYGYSVAKWDGDTLVVDTTGMNDKSWADFYGHPHSEAMHVTERYRRITANTLVIDITLDDPMAYTKPWVGDPRVYRLEPKSTEIPELLCVPEEEDSFTNRIRMPAVPKAKK